MQKVERKIEKQSPKIAFYTTLHYSRFLFLTAVIFRQDYNSHISDTQKKFSKGENMESWMKILVNLKLHCANAEHDTWTGVGKCNVRLQDGGLRVNLSSLRQRLPGPS